MTDLTPPETYPTIQGRCPACGWASLFIGSGGYVTCSRLDCPNPSAADGMLHGSDRFDASWQPQDDGSWTLDIGAGRGVITMPRGTTMRERAQFTAAWEAMSSRPGSAATEATEPSTEEQPLLVPRNTATALHEALGQLLGDEGAHAISRVRQLHRNEYEACAECTHESSVLWPCPTIRALNGGEQPGP